jgi:hypothetical protein
VTVGTGELAVGGECAVLPIGAALAPDEVFVSIWELADGRDLGSRSATSRDDLAPDHGFFHVGCGVDPDAVRGWMGGFTTGGRPFSIWVVMGSAVSDAEQAKVWQVIDTFTPLASADEPSTGERPRFEPSGTVPLASVPQGVTGHTVAGYEVILSRTGDEVLAFLSGTPRAAGSGDSLYWCESIDLFLELPLSGSEFSRDGHRVGGPAPRDLDRAAVTIAGDDLRLDLGNVTLGAPHSTTTTDGAVESGVVPQDRRYYVAADDSWPAGFTSSQVCDHWEPSDHDQGDLADFGTGWFPDLDGDGEADLMVLAGQEVRFAIARDGDDLDVVDEHGDVLTVSVGDDVTVTCQSDGVWVQQFDRPSAGVAAGSLRLYRLEVDDSVGVLIPSPSFVFGPDFELPALGAGCPTSR